LHTIIRAKPRKSVAAHRHFARIRIELAEFSTKAQKMNWNLSLGPMIALIAGILILIVPRLLNFIVAIYLIMIGLLGLFGTGAIKI
jgi:hypothetical protein